MSAAADRLAASRAAIAAALRGPGDGRGPSGSTREDPAHGSPAQDGDDQQEGVAAWLRRRWEDHPAHLLVEIASPLAQRWVARHPLTFVGFAACVGAGLVLWRPWRLVSATGLLLAVLRSSRLPGLALMLLRSRSPRAARASPVHPPSPHPPRRSPP